MDAVHSERDEILLARHLAGEAGAFDALVRRYAEELYRFLLKMVNNPSAAEDLVQEAFLQVHSAAATFDPERSFKPWLYTIAANKARDHMRSRGRRRELSLEPPDEDDASPSGRAAESAAGQSADAEESDVRRAQVRRLIEQMPEHLRLILMLGYYQQLPYAEIAEILGIPVGTVKSRLHAAVGHFARLWQKETGEVAR